MPGDGATTRPHPPPAPPPTQKVRVGVDYTFSDGIGVGQVGYCFDVSQEFLLTTGQIVTADKVEVGMRFVIDGGMVATVTAVDAPRAYAPPPRDRDANGNTAKRVVGTVRYRGEYPVLDLVVGDRSMKTTPGHRFYSLDRGGWVDAETLAPGEWVESEDWAPAPVTRISPARFERIDLHNVEVEDFHTYFVGTSSVNSVWSHNGLEGGCAIPKPAQRQRQIPESDGYWSSSPAKGAPKDGIPGESYWHSTDPLITSHPEYRPIKFTDRYPDFSPTTKVTVEIGVTGKPGFRDHFAASKELAKQLIAEPELATELGIPKAVFMKKNGNPNASKVYEWMKSQPDGGLTWHHLEDAKTMAMVPWAIHEIPHAGGAAIARQTARNAAG
jgi:hypothetical protein